jgi:hypothetical protein
MFTGTSLQVHRPPKKGLYWKAEVSCFRESQQCFSVDFQPSDIAAALSEVWAGKALEWQKQHPMSAPIFLYLVLIEAKGHSSRPINCHQWRLGATGFEDAPHKANILKPIMGTTHMRFD